MFFVIVRKLGLFKSVNIIISIFCFVTMLYNYCGVSVLTPNKAKSDFDGSSYLYELKDDFFYISKDGNLVGKLKTGSDFKFQKNSLPNLNCNAAAIGAAGAIAAGAGATGAAVTAAVVTGHAGKVATAAVVLVGAATPVGWFLGGLALG